MLRRLFHRCSGFSANLFRSKNVKFTRYLATTMAASGASSFLYSVYLAKQYSMSPSVSCESGDEVKSNGIEDCASDILGSVKCDEPPDPVPGMNAYGWTPLHSACANGNYHEAEQIILGSLGEVDINAQDQFNFRIPGDLNEVSRIALQRQNEFRNISFTTRTQGATALHYAMYSGNKKLVKLLFKHGADPTIKDDQALSPLDYADDGSVRELFKELVKDYEEMKRVAEKNLRKQFPLEKRLKEVIVGQDGPIGAVASAIRRRENGWHDEDRPLVFLFLGSSGIGKTELAKQVAKYIHKDDRKGFIRIDMSEFQTKHEVAKFIGSPPGYVGYEEGGQLTKKLKNSKNKNVVVLLDEVEKAHPDILTIMLQLFDEGRLTDGQGVTVECKNAIFILTSNLAQHEIADEAENLRNEAKSNQSVVLNEASLISRKFQNSIVYPILRSHFKRDEFLGRIDEILYFLPFNENELGEIVDKELQRWAEKAKIRHGMKLEWDPEVIGKLSEGYNIRYGARSIRHEVERRVVNQIAKAHENDQIQEGDGIRVYLDPLDKNNIKFKIIPGVGKEGKKESRWSWLR